MIKMVLKIIAAYLLSVLTTLVIASVVSTQFVLAELTSMGISVTFAVRVKTTIQDILGTAPAFATMAGIALLIAFLFAAFVSRKLAAPYRSGFTIAGACGMLTAGFASSQLLGATLIAGSRGLGIIGFILAGAIGGWLFAKLTRKQDMNHV